MLPEPQTSDQALPRQEWIAVGALAALIFLVQMACYVSGLVVSPGELVDADGYSRLVRVRHLADTGAWFDTMVPHSNPMVPETNQWCRWIDLSLLAGGRVLGLFVGPENGLFLWAVAFSPFLLACCGPALAWASAPLLGARSRFFVVLLFYVQPGVQIYLAAGRPDHHGVLLLLFIAVVGCLLRALTDRPQTARWATAAGVFQALALTVSIEALFACLLGLVATGSVWLIGRPDGLRLARSHATALLAASLLGVATTIPWTAWSLSETDRLSPAYLVALGSVALFWISLSCFRPVKKTARRLMISLAGATTCVALTVGSAPTLLRHPQLTANPRIGDLWLFSIQEYHPLAEKLADWPWALLIWMGSALVAIPWMIRLVWLQRHRTLPLLPWSYLLAGSLAFGVLHVLQIRWCTYFEVLAVFPSAWLLARVLDHLGTSGGQQGLKFAGARVLVMMFFAFGFPFIGLIGRSWTARSPLPESSAHPHPPAHDPNLRALATWLNGPDFSATTPETILTFLDFGPELLYRTPHHLIATPNHRNADGMLYLYDTMKAPAEESEERLQRKQVSLIILHPGSHEGQFYNQENPPRSFYQDLIAGRTPDHLHRLNLPENLGGFMVYRVVR